MSRIRSSSRPLLVLSLVVAALASAARAGTFDVVAIEPALNATAAPTSSVVRVTFDAPVDPATAVDANIQVFGRWSGVVPGSLSLSPDGLTLTFQPSRPYFPGELVSVMLSSAFGSVGGASLDAGHTSWFFASSGQGTGTFSLAGQLRTRLQGESFVQSYGIYPGDLDGDGAPDFSIPNENTDDVRVMLNDGCGTFGPIDVIPLPFGATPSANEGQDYDGDGDIDFATANIAGDTTSVMLGDGLGGYGAPTTLASGAGPRGITVLDAEGDGDVDLVLAHRVASNLRLFRNDGTGTFTADPPFDGGGAGESGISAGDANGDGIADVFVANYSSDTVSIVLGDGTGGFAPSGATATGVRPWMTAVGDVDGDGALDVATCNSGSASASVARGDGAGGLLPAQTLPVGSFPIAIDLGDVDGDGALDLVASNLSSASWTVYRNDGTGGFGDGFMLSSSAAGSCATLVDYDRDGAVDIVGLDEFDDLVFLYRQNTILEVGVQPRTCAGTLRVNNLALSAGFGGQAPHEVAVGETFFLGVTADPDAAFALSVGLAVEPGAGTPFGLLNVSLPLLIVLQGAVDAAGEAVLALPVPGGAPVGVPFALQAFVGAPGDYGLTNPEGVVLVP